MERRFCKTCCTDLNARDGDFCSAICKLEATERFPPPPLPARGLLGGITERPTGDTTDRAVAALVAPPVLPTDSEERKMIPIFSGVLNYFPLAIAAVARHSKRGNDKHNPGEPLHWSRDKSNDHADCIARHLIDIETVHSATGEYEEAQALAWRALAKLQELEEKRLGAPVSRGSTVAVRADAAPAKPPTCPQCGAPAPWGDSDRDTCDCSRSHCGAV
jgi:hypothetical protein